MIRRGFSLSRAIQSATWPAASANLEYAAVWGRKGVLGAEAVPISDGTPATRISALLEPEVEYPVRRRVCDPTRGSPLQAAKSMEWASSVSPELAREWIDESAENADVFGAGIEWGGRSTPSSRFLGTSFV